MDILEGTQKDLSDPAHSSLALHLTSAASRFRLHICAQDFRTGISHMSGARGSNSSGPPDSWRFIAGFGLEVCCISDLAPKLWAGHPARDFLNFCKPWKLLEVGLQGSLTHRWNWTLCQLHLEPGFKSVSRTSGPQSFEDLSTMEATQGEHPWSSHPSLALGFMAVAFQSWTLLRAASIGSASTQRRDLGGAECRTRS